MENKEIILKEDLEKMASLENEANSSINDANISLMVARIKELEYENAALKLYMKYGMSENDSYDKTTGRIIKHNANEETKEE